MGLAGKETRHPQERVDFFFHSIIVAGRYRDITINKISPEIFRNLDSSDEIFIAIARVYHRYGLSTRNEMLDKC